MGEVVGFPQGRRVRGIVERFPSPDDIAARQQAKYWRTRRWTSAAGTNGAYLISNFGEVRRKGSKDTLKPRYHVHVSETCKRVRGTLKYRLYMDGKRCTRWLRKLYLDSWKAVKDGKQNCWEG